MLPVSRARRKTAAARNQPGIFVRHPVPWKVVDEGDGRTTVLDANGNYAIHMSVELTIADWTRIVDSINQRAENAANNLATAQ